MRTTSSQFLVRKRKTKKRARFIPAVETLEARLTPSGDPLVQPQVLHSVNGVLNVTLTEQVGPVKIGDNVVQDAWTYNGMYPGPTLELNPGDALNINLVNKLPLSTNLHTHGLHVSPIGNSDNILLDIPPGASFQYHVEIPANHPEGLYWYHPHVHGTVNLEETRGLSGMLVIGRPDGGYPQLDGLNQILMAANAAPIVSDTNQPGIVAPTKFTMKDTNVLDPALFTFTVNGQINPVITMQPNQYAVVSMLDNSANSFYTAGFTKEVDAITGAPLGAQTTTAASSNGVPTKTATTINVASTAGFEPSGLINVAYTGAPGTGDVLYHYSGLTPTSFTGLVEQGKDFGGTLVTGGAVVQLDNHMWPVAFDGNPFTFVHNPGDPSEPNLIAFTPARRFSFIIGGFQAGHTYVFQNVGYRNPAPANPPGPELGDGTNVWPPFDMFTVVVAGPPVPGGTPSFVPVFDPATGKNTKPPLSPPNNYFKDLSAPSVVVAQKRTVTFDQTVGEFSMMIDGINGAQFPDNIVFQPRLGTVEEWKIINDTDDDHPFHLHTNAFQSVGPGQGPAFDKLTGLNGFWLDTLNVPRHTTQTIRIDFEDYLGEMVYHCHRVEHEDTGMMAAVQVLPAQSILVTGAGPGGAPQVNVYNGVTKALIRKFDAFPGFTGGVNVAVGDVNHDGVSDIIVAAGAGGGPNVVVVDGKSIAGTGPLVDLYSFMAFAGGFAGGVNVAAGDINTDGFDDIICGAGAGGGPEVTVFSGKDGSMLNAFFAFDPGFTGGVSVASGDLDGKGRFQIVVGAGAGGGPQVRVFDDQGMLMSSFFAFDQGFTGGVNVATGRVRGIGFASIICGAGAGGGPTVNTFQAGEMHAMDTGAPMEFSLIGSFAAYDPGFTGGVRVGSLSQTLGTNYLTGAGPNGGPQVSTFDGVTHKVLDSFFALDQKFTGGVSVAAN